MDNQTMHLVENELKTIPFVDILIPYTKSFLNELKETNVSSILVNKMNTTLLQEMSSAAEVTLQEELDDFKDKGKSSYQEFVETTNSILVTKYPVLDKILNTLAQNYLQHIQNIHSNFSKDFDLIAKCFSLKTNENITVKDIDSSLGDGHSGESTALITLSDDTKLIYKPRNVDTTNSYNHFIDWVNQKLSTDLKTIKCVSCGSYGWLEFIDYKEVNTSDELEEYYHKAGILLAVTLLIGSKDCHFENIIVTGKNPVIIDHETIIQPTLSAQSLRTWDEEHKIPVFSVLESMLIVNKGTGVQLQCIGYGIKGNLETMVLAKKVVNPNTIDSKRDTRFIKMKQVKHNIPSHNGTYVFANDYKDSFTEGFTAAYDMFMNSKEELMSDNSPIQSFQNQTIRYVWRPTFIYFKILQYMRAASFMSSFETYNSKLYDLMSKAYKKENAEKYKFILEFEMEQMLKGDIPLFDLNSSDCHLGEEKSFKIFKNNCVDNIRHRISSLDTKHKNEQIEYISNWLQVK